MVHSDCIISFQSCGTSRGWLADQLLIVYISSALHFECVIDLFLLISYLRPYMENIWIPDFGIAPSTLHLFRTGFEVSWSLLWYVVYHIKAEFQLAKTHQHWIPEESPNVKFTPFVLMFPSNKLSNIFNTHVCCLVLYNFIYKSFIFVQSPFSCGKPRSLIGGTSPINEPCSIAILS